MNKEGKEIKVRISTVILSIIIMVLAVVIAIGIVYIRSSNNNLANVNLNTSSNNNLNNTSYQNIKNAKAGEVVKDEQLDINDEQVKNLYEYIPAFNEEKFRENAYQSKKVTIKDVSVECLLANAFKNLQIAENLKEPVMDVDGQTQISGWYKFNENILQNKVKEMYGENIENKNFDIGYAKSLEYQDGKYLYSEGGSSSETQLNIRGMIKAYKKDENIYIEDNYLCFKHELKEDGEEQGFYSSTDTNEELNMFENNMATYVHMFKKNNEGKYYWYSSEPIK